MRALQNRNILRLQLDHVALLVEDAPSAVAVTSIQVRSYLRRLGADSIADGGLLRFGSASPASRPVTTIGGLK